MEKSAKGFTACGQYYVMGNKDECYIEYCKKLLNEIKESSIKHKLLKGC